MAWWKCYVWSQHRLTLQDSSTAGKGLLLSQTPAEQVPKGLEAARQSVRSQDMLPLAFRVGHVLGRSQGLGQCQVALWESSRDAGLRPTTAFLGHIGLI